MAIVLRYVNDRGIVMEHFIGLVHVVDSTSLALKRGLMNSLPSMDCLSPSLEVKDMTELLICEVNLMD
ncbi:unnamed protein product [Rhodiola kirilowii]